MLMSGCDLWYQRKSRWTVQYRDARNLETTDDNMCKVAQNIGIPASGDISVRNKVANEGEST